MRHVRVLLLYGRFGTYSPGSSGSIQQWVWNRSSGDQCHFQGTQKLWQKRLWQKSRKKRPIVVGPLVPTIGPTGSPWKITYISLFSFLTIKEKIVTKTSTMCPLLLPFLSFSFFFLNLWVFNSMVVIFNRSSIYCIKLETKSCRIS